MRRIKINIREEAAAAAISHLRSQGCCTRRRKKRAEEDAISERREDGERGAGDGDMIQPYMAIGRRDKLLTFCYALRRAPVGIGGGCCWKRRQVRAAKLDVFLATKPINFARANAVS